MGKAVVRSRSTVAMPGWGTLIAQHKTPGAFYENNKFHQIVVDVAQSPAAKRIAADDESRYETTEIERTAWAHRRATAAVLRQPREKKEVYVGRKDMTAEEYVAAGGDIHTFHLYDQNQDGKLDKDEQRYTKQMEIHNENERARAVILRGRALESEAADTIRAHERNTHQKGKQDFAGKDKTYDVESTWEHYGSTYHSKPQDVSKHYYSSHK